MTAAVPPIPPEEIRRLLVHGTNWIGDVVLISPALRALREAYPRAEIHYLARGALAEAVRPNPCIDRVVPYDRADHHSPPFGTLRFARELRRCGFDLAVLFPKSLEAALIARLAGIPRRAGWRTDGRGPLITHGRKMTPEDQALHHVRQFFEPARFAGASPPRDGFRVEFPLAGEDREAAGRLLASAGLGGDGFLLALHPGASKPPRAWHPARFARAAERIAGRRGGAVLLLGGPRDVPLCEEVRAGLRAPAADLSGRTSIRLLAALIERAGLFLGNDSGAMHLAAALGTPLAALFGPGSPERTAPVAPSSRVRVLTRLYPCSPCRQDFFRECAPAPSGRPWCLEEIEVEDVVQAAEDLLSNREP
jgi:heptosyltransferase-2